MVEINNHAVRRSSICWRGRRELITDVRKPEIMVMTSLSGGELFTDYSDHPRKHHAKPKTQINRRRTLPASFPLVGCLRQRLKASLPKSQDAVALQQIGRGALPMIDRGDIRRAIDRCSNIWASLPGAGYGQFEHKADSLIAKFKEAGGTVREIDVWTDHPPDYLLSDLSASSSACHGLLIITVITPLPTKPSATKMPENWSWRTRQLLTCRCVGVVLLRSMQNTRRCFDLSWNDALRDDDRAGRRRLRIKAVCQSVREATTASGVDNAASPTGRHLCERDYFTPQREADHYAKTTGRNPEVY